MDSLLKELIGGLISTGVYWIFGAKVRRDRLTLLLFAGELLLLPVIRYVPSGMAPIPVGMFWAILVILPLIWIVPWVRDYLRPDAKPPDFNL